MKGGGVRYICYIFGLGGDIEQTPHLFGEGGNRAGWGHKPVDGQTPHLLECGGTEVVGVDGGLCNIQTPHFV